jgi:predicted metal-dependent hydrolase
LRGIEQFNRREYFECHETLELIWNAEPCPIRTLYNSSVSQLT